jgi:uncharacterized protein YqgV (UPF0045/DUF77 family)
VEEESEEKKAEYEVKAEGRVMEQFMAEIDGSRRTAIEIQDGRKAEETMQNVLDHLRKVGGQVEIHPTKFRIESLVYEEVLIAVELFSDPQSSDKMMRECFVVRIYKISGDLFDFEDVFEQIKRALYGQ